QSAETGNLSIHKSRSQAAGTAGARKTRLLHRKVIACRPRSPHDEKTRPDRRHIPKMINLSPAIAAILLVAVSHSLTPSANSHAQSASKHAQSCSKKDSKGGAARGAVDEQAMRARALKLHRSSIVVDTHNDITSPMLDEHFDLGSAGDDPSSKVKTHTDLRRMKAGGLGAEFFAIYVGKEFVSRKPS